MPETLTISEAYDALRGGRTSDIYVRTRAVRIAVMDALKELNVDVDDPPLGHDGHYIYHVRKKKVIRGARPTAQTHPS